MASRKDVLLEDTQVEEVTCVVLIVVRTAEVAHLAFALKDSLLEQA
jgi:hypothetical protein